MDTKLLDILSATWPSRFCSKIAPGTDSCVLIDHHKELYSDKADKYFSSNTYPIFSVDYDSSAVKVDAIISDENTGNIGNSKAPFILLPHYFILFITDLAVKYNLLNIKKENTRDKWLSNYMCSVLLCLSSFKHVFLIRPRTYICNTTAVVENGRHFVAQEKEMLSRILNEGSGEARLITEL